MIIRQFLRHNNNKNVLNYSIGKCGILNKFNPTVQSNVFFRLQSTVTQDDQTTSPASPGKLPKLTLYTGTDCQLCDVAKNVLDSIEKEVAFSLDLYNIRDDNLPEISKWRRAYQYDIPVLHLNGKEIARHRLNRETVIDQIKAAQKAKE